MKGSVRFALQVCLFGPLCIALYFTHVYFSLISTDVLTDLSHSRNLELAALLASAVLAGLIAGAIFIYPFLRLYGRNAVLVSAIASSLAAVNLLVSIGKSSKLPFVNATYALEILTLALCLPLGVWLIRDRFRHNPSRPMETPCAN
jgi:hypothetical protein